MKDFLFFSERLKISEKFFAWCEEVGAEQRLLNFLSWLDENDAINLSKCRAIIDDKKPEPVTDPLTLKTVKEVLSVNKEQREALETIRDSTNNFIYNWGTNGRLIDRDTVIAAMRALNKAANVPLKEDK